MPTIRRMEGRAKVTKEVLCEEARFILANVMAEARYGRQNRYDDIRRVCEGAVSIPFSEYIGFLEKSGYLRHDRATESLEVTPRARPSSTAATSPSSPSARSRTSRSCARAARWRCRAAAVPMGTQSGVMQLRRPRSREIARASAAQPLPRKDIRRCTTSGGRPSAVAGGEIQLGARRRESLREARVDRLGRHGHGVSRAPGRAEPRGRAQGDPRSVRVLQRGPAQRDRAAVHRRRARVGQPRAPEHPADPRRQPVHRVSRTSSPSSRRTARRAG